MHSIKFLTGDALKDHTWTDEKDKQLNLFRCAKVTEFLESPFREAEMVVNWNPGFLELSD
jgi:hypothetical protein